jgi:DNA ligase-1
MFRPMLAPREDPLSYPNFFRKLPYPLFGSPKYDGIRNVVKGLRCMSRTATPLPSRQVQTLFSGFEDMDGELIEGLPTDPDVYNRTQSHVMSFNKPGDLRFFVFDYTPSHLLKAPFTERLMHLEDALVSHVGDEAFGRVHLVEQTCLEDEEALLRYETKQLRLGFEGIMLKAPGGPYKQGRATFLQGLVYKLKRFTDDEAVITGLEERMTNCNLLEFDALGYAKRSQSREGLVPANTLGRFVADWRGEEIVIATGSFKQDQCKEIWVNPRKYVGKTLKFRYFDHGVKNLPRFPRAVGFRDPIDM